MADKRIDTGGGANIGKNVDAGRDFIGRDQRINTQVNIHGESYLGQIWELLDSDLQDALSLAYNQARREGNDIIKTKYLFAALVRLKPNHLAEIFSEMPYGGLPAPIEPNLGVTSDILLANPTLSNCVADSLTSLTPKVNATRKLSSTDVFVDIAKHGKGYSVNQLRKVGVTSETIDEIVGELGISVVGR